MYLDFLIHLILIITSIGSNFLSAFSGGGAGLIQLPILLFLGVAFPKALATHKIASVALGIGASIRHLKEDTLKRKLCILIITCGCPGVLLGASTILFLPNKISTLMLGLLTLFLATYSFSTNEREDHSNSINSDIRRFYVGAIVLFFLGFLNGSLTSGSGLFVTIWLVKWFNLSYKEAIAYTLLLVGVIWNLTGAVVLGVSTEVKWEWVPTLILGSLAGGYLGAHFAILKGEKIIKTAFEFVAIIMGFSLLIKGFSI